MSIVGGLDIHRKQITFDYLEIETGEVERGQIAPADRAHLAGLAGGAVRRAGRCRVRGGGVHGVAVCRRGAGPRPGWRRIWPSRPTRPRCGAANGTPRPTGPTRGICGSCWPMTGCRSAGSRRRRCWSAGRCWSPTGICGPSTPPGCSASMRCCSTRVPAAGASGAAHRAGPGRVGGRSRPRGCRRPGRSRSRPPWTCSPPRRPSSTRCAASCCDAARHLTGARVLTARLYGVGPITALALTCWLGGAGRFSSARKAVRFAGLDVTVYSSDGKRTPGHLSRQGPPVLRWCVYEAGKTHARAHRPRPRLLRAGRRTASTANAPRLSEARKIVRQACHILTELGDDALTAT